MEYVINNNMESICQKLSNTFIAKSFYLAGGTGLALQINHRSSDDLDFIYENDNGIDSESIITTMEEQLDKKVRVQLKESNQLDLLVEGSKLTFLSYPFPLMFYLKQGENVSDSLKGIKIASVKEIALMKAYSMGRRSSYKDYIDMYYILKNEGIDLGFIIENAKKKYEKTITGSFSEKLFREQLVYTDDVTDKEEAMSKVFDRNLTQEAIEEFLKEMVMRQI